MRTSDGSFALEEFLASGEARAVTGASEDERREIAARLGEALVELGRPLAKLSADDLHAFLFHLVPEQFDPVDSLVPHVAPVLQALVKFGAPKLQKVVDESLPDLEDALRHGHSHGHHHDHEPEEPYVRSAPKVGRNDPCPCGSGKKFKKCHGA
jgi:uncharacterized protein YecA (UPF0149 family)